MPERCDVCVMGAGAAGILLALQLTEMGCSVMLLEGGGRHQEARSQKLYRGENTGLPFQGIHLGRFRTLGGSTTQWGGQILELSDVDFGRRNHVEDSGWPFSKSVLKASYERALRFEGLDEAEPEDTRVGAKLGLQDFEIGPEFSLLYSRHCQERNFANRHADTFVKRQKLSVIYHANVVGLNMNSNGSAIESAQVRGFSGRTAKVAADRFVICMGGIESTRLLLQPGEAGQRVWQTNGLLGRFFQDHILLDCIPLTKVSLQPVEQYFGCTWREGFQYRTHIRLSSAAQADNGTLDIAGTINPFQRDIRGPERAFRLMRQLFRENEIPGVSDLARSAPHLPKTVFDILQRRVLGEAQAWKKTMLTLHCEQSPRSDSQVALSNRRDALGMFITKLNWQVSDQEIHTLRTYLRLASRAFSKNKLAGLEIPKGFFEDDGLVRSLCGDSYHHMGGCRMSTSPRNGIVDTNLKLHGIANGYVCSTSVFPSSGFCNPTHTLLALSVRLSDHLASMRANDESKCA